MHACPLVDEAITYSLGQMTAEERLAFQAHLATCAACRLKLDEIADTIDLLPLATPPVAPPPDLRAKVMNRVAQETAGMEHRADPVRRRTLPIWAAAAAVAALLLGSYSLLRIQELQQRLAALQSAAPVERAVSLTGTELAPGANGRVVVAHGVNSTHIALEAHSLPPLQPGEAYQLWLIKDGKRISGGVFVVDGTGTGGVATWLPGSVEFDALGVTREPDALGLQPRGTKVLGSTT